MQRKPCNLKVIGFRYSFNATRELTPRASWNDVSLPKPELASEVSTMTATLLPLTTPNI